MYLYHYTNSKGFAGIANNTAAKGGGGDFPGGEGQDGNPARWAVLAGDVQIGSWYTDQHAPGFYMTDSKPSELDNKEYAKLGVNMRDDDPRNELYVFVFRTNLAGRVDQIADRPVQRVKNTDKFYIQPTKIQTDGKIFVTEPWAIWCGPAKNCPDYRS